MFFIINTQNLGPTNLSSSTAFPFSLTHLTTLTKRPSWPWSYGSWIFNYLCNQCLSPL